jgi:hypothetical protein
MRRRLVSAAFGAGLTLVVTACGGGNGEPAVLPATGVEVCDELDRTERFRYVFDFVIESPKQEPAPTGVAVEGPGYAISPTAETFRFAQKFNGAFVQPDRADYEISTPGEPERPTVRGIRIGPSQYYFLANRWQLASQPSAFPFAPPALCDAIVSPLDLTGKSGGIEDVGGTAAQHIRLTGVPLPVMSQLFGPASDMGRLLTTYDMDLWLSEKDARLVKVEATSKAIYPFGRELNSRLVFEVSSHNDDGIEIKPPL